MGLEYSKYSTIHLFWYCPHECTDYIRGRLAPELFSPGIYYVGVLRQHSKVHSHMKLFDYGLLGALFWQKLLDVEAFLRLQCMLCLESEGPKNPLAF